MDDLDTKEATHPESTPSSPLRNIAMKTSALAEEQRFRSESEPIMSAVKTSSTTSLNSSLTSDRDSVISTSSTSSDANIYMYNSHMSKDGTKGLCICFNTLKVYSLILYGGHFQNFLNLNFCIFLYIVLL